MNTMLAVLGLSGGELTLVVVAILILFGAKKIPEFAKGLGKGINEFKKASREVTDEIERADETPTPAPKAPAPSVSEQHPAPTSSTPKEQQTLNWETGEIEAFSVKGRHDLCIALRVPVVLEAVTAMVLADLLLLEQRTGRIV